MTGHTWCCPRSFTLAFPTLMEGGGFDHEHTMSDFDAMAEDIKSFGKSILELFGVQLDGAACASWHPSRR